MDHQPFIAGRVKTSQDQQPLLEGRERRQVTDDLPRQLHDREGQVAEGLQHALGGGAGRAALRLIHIETRYRRLVRRQLLADGMLQHGEDTDANRQQADQPRGMVVAAQIDGSQREGRAFESAQAALDQIFVAIGQDCLLQAELVGWAVGGVDPPAQTTRTVVGCRS